MTVPGELLAIGVGLGVRIGVAVAVGIGVGLGGVGLGVTIGVAVGFGLGVGSGVGVGATIGVGGGATTGVGVGVTIGGAVCVELVWLLCPSKIAPASTAAPPRPYNRAEFVPGVVPPLGGGHFAFWIALRFAVASSMNVLSPPAFAAASCCWKYVRAAA